MHYIKQSVVPYIKVKHNKITFPVMSVDTVAQSGRAAEAFTTILPIASIARGSCCGET